jgi:hypothetical protein
VQVGQEALEVGLEDELNRLLWAYPTSRPLVLFIPFLALRCDVNWIDDGLRRHGSAIVKQLNISIRADRHPRDLAIDASFFARFDQRRLEIGLAIHAPSLWQHPLAVRA